MTTVWLGKSYANVKIVPIRPKGSIKIGSTKHTIHYAKGLPEFVVPRKGTKLKRLRK